MSYNIYLGNNIVDNIYLGNTEITEADLLGSQLNQNEPEVETYITGLTTPLSFTQIVRLNTLVSSLKSGLSITNLSDFFDTIYILAGETRESSLKNLVSNNYHCTEVNTLSWTQFEGFTGNGSDSYLNTNYKAATNAIKFTQNDASHGIYLRKNIAEAKSAAGALKAGAIGTSAIVRSGGGNNMSLCLNSAEVASTGGLVPDSRGMWIFTRSAYTSFDVYRNGFKLVTITANSSALENVNEYMCCWNNNGTAGSFSAQQIAIRFRAKSCTQDQVNIITAAFDTL